MTILTESVSNCKGFASNFGKFGALHKRKEINMSELYKRLETLVHERGMTFYDLSARTGIGQSRFSELRTGKREKLSIKNLKTLADFFGVTVTYLMYGEEVPVNPEPQTVRPDDTISVVFSKFKTEDLLLWLSEITKELQRRQNRPEE
jgi:transcriptional regulator with XRE-family HTH domain